MRWLVHGERTLYDTEWVRLTLVDVEIPDDTRFEHHVVRATRPAAGTVVVDGGRVLLLWRHRFITDTWGWEIPAGRIEPGETAEEAAGREAVEETGWRPSALSHLVSYRPMIGQSDQEFHVFLARGATRVGAPTDRAEAERVEWVAVETVPELIDAGQLTDGLSLTGLLYALAFDRFGTGLGPGRAAGAG